METRPLHTPYEFSPASLKPPPIVMMEGSRPFVTMRRRYASDDIDLHQYASQRCLSFLTTSTIGTMNHLQFLTAFFVMCLSLTLSQRTFLLGFEGPKKEGWIIENIAGTGVAGFEGDGGPAISAQINDPFGVIRGPDDAIWFCEFTGQRIRKILPDGRMVTVAGTGEVGYSGDEGPAIQATFHRPHEIRFDKEGDLYIVDMGNHAVRRIEMKTGVISTIAGTGTAGYSGDGGAAKEAQLKQPHSIQFSPSGDLFICDIGNHVIRRIDRKTGTISTFAGTGKPGPTPDGSPIAGTPLNGPRSLDFDSEGNIWLATREGNQVFKLDLKTNKIHHIAGTGKSGFEGNGGLALQANLKGPKGIAIDGNGDVWLADTESHSVRRIRAKDGVLELMVGTGEKGDGPTGDPLQCRLARLHGIYVDRDQSILIGDSEAHRIRVLRRKE